MLFSLPFDGAGVHSVPGFEAASAQMLQGQPHHGDGCQFPSFDCYFDPTGDMDGSAHHSTNPGHLDHSSTVGAWAYHAPVTTDRLKPSANLPLPFPSASAELVSEEVLLLCLTAPGTKEGMIQQPVEGPTIEPEKIVKANPSHILVSGHALTLAGIQFAASDGKYQENAVANADAVSPVSIHVQKRRNMLSEFTQSSHGGSFKLRPLRKHCFSFTRACTLVILWSVLRVT